MSDNNGQMMLFDYQALDLDTRKIVQAEDAEFEANMTVAGNHFLRACHNVRRIHDALLYKRPGFVDWCASKRGLKQWTANRMLNVAEMLVDSTDISIESREALYLLAESSTPASARQEALMRAEAGEEITHARAKDIVEAHVEQEDEGFVCDDCGEVFSTEVWECPTCQHHWSPEDEQCRNCYKPAPPAAPKPVPRHPHSDRLIAWLRLLQSRTLVIRVEEGGIREILKEQDKWNSNDVNHYILPMLRALRGVVDEFTKEIGDAFEQERSDVLS